MKGAKRFLPVALLLIPLLAQGQAPRHDKGAFVEYHNEFYSKIRQSIARESQAHAMHRVFRMDFTGIDIPKSVDEFTKSWCNEPVSQGNTGTCWCFATTSFYESEIYRQTGQALKLSQMYTVYWEYVEKAREFVRTRGESFFGEGSETNAPARMIRLHGIVPYEVFPGKPDNQEFYNHAPMFREMKGYLDHVKATNAWDEESVIRTIRAILDHYIGTPPEKFTWKGKEYTPLEWMKEVAHYNPDDYVNFMSLMEAPYWTLAEYKVPDNWWHSKDYHNVPLDVFMDAIKEAVKNGYTVAIGGDVSESGYSPENDVAMVPTYDIPSEYIDEYARQFRFTNHSTTDDHAIHIVGYTIKPNGWWFLVKDSGSGARNGNNKGWYFYHEDYVKLKMMTFTVHKDAVKDILKRFNDS